MNLTGTVFENAKVPVALGLLNHTTYDPVAALLDAFVEAGGSILDTAWIYNGGLTESLVGQWFARTGARGAITLVGKGAHTPHCDPESIGRELGESLERMGTDYLDAYLMHRDNTDTAVGEFVDALHAEVTSGRIRSAVGGSNWTAARFDEAIAYATANHRTVPSVLSNHFSLATMNEAIWPGTITSATPEWAAWLADRKVTNMAWSSQSRGFFAGPDPRTAGLLHDADTVRVWHSSANFARRERAVVLANELGCSPVQVALAYVAAQPFSQLPIVGPETVQELQSSLAAFAFQLTANQVAWLEFGK